MLISQRLKIFDWEFVRMKDLKKKFIKKFQTFSCIVCFASELFGWT